MLKQILSVVVLAVLLSTSVFAKDVKKTQLSAAMSCTGCKNKIEKALKNTDGVEKVNISVENQSVMVEHDNDVVNQEQLISAINAVDAKFEAKQFDGTKKATKACTKECKHSTKEASAKPCQEAK